MGILEAILACQIVQLALLIWYLFFMPDDEDED